MKREGETLQVAVQLCADFAEDPVPDQSKPDGTGILCQRAQARDDNQRQRHRGEKRQAGQPGQQVGGR